MAGTVLLPGDIAIIGFNFDNPDEFAFVTLVDIVAGTEISFTDNGWQANGTFRDTEGTFTWTAGTDIAAGTVINPTVSSVAFSASGDQIIAYQGDSNNPTFIYALNSEGNPGVWQSDATSSNTSALPTGLVNGETAVALDEIDNAVYTGITSGTKEELLAAISDQSNWSGDNSNRQTMPTNSFTVSGGTTPVATELFISEYIEGSSNNKAIEIANFTGNTVDLTDYSLEFYFNGNTSAGTIISLAGNMVADGDVFVIADNDADAAILAVADLTSTSSFFNGDDAIVLRNGSNIIDVIGQIGVDPGSEWSGGGIGTQNETLRRQSSITQGDNNGNDPFDPSVEWEGFAQDTFDGLGSHTIDGGSSGTTLAIAPNDADKAEGDTGNTAFTFTVTRSGDITGTTSVDFAVTSTEANSVDFGGILPSGTISFAANESSQTVIINVSGDTDPELDENFTVTLSNPSGSATLTTATANGTIQNDDGIPITLISTVQGSGVTSPLQGQTVTIEAVVVGDYQDGANGTNGDLNGFFVQEEDADADGNALTSEVDGVTRIGKNVSNKGFRI
ncbi:MAG: lamin tail domain-containing protein [Crocosphaera sp.]|nr:lamin tail domain-containing protein [Crocosphaera sp.]